eukprot:scaffold529_cov107-Skeletonema_dohrnii-CCMP3373.AAC.1
MGSIYRRIILKWMIKFIDRGVLHAPLSRADVLQYHRDQFILAREAIKQGRKLEDASVRLVLRKIKPDQVCFTSRGALLAEVARWRAESWNLLDFKEYGKIEDWCFTDEVTDMSGLFQDDCVGGCSDFNRNIGSWDVSRVTNMTAMFQYATAFNQDIGNWEVSQGDNMQNMFDGATAFNQNIVSWNNWNEDMMIAKFGTMFQNAPAMWANYGRHYYLLALPKCG